MKVEIKLNDINSFLDKYIIIKSPKKYVAKYIVVHRNTDGYYLESFKQISENQYTTPQNGGTTDEKFLLTTIRSFVWGCRKNEMNLELHTDINDVWK